MTDLATTNVQGSLVGGAVAGAAGTVALNLATYLDMAVRGRPPSGTPGQSVQKLFALVGLEVPGDGRARVNRTHGMGAVLGLVTGVAVGAGFGVVDRLLGGAPGRLPVVARASLLTVAALVVANGPMALLGVSDPRTWSSEDWTADVLPHVAYGWVAASTFRARVTPRGPA